MTAYLTRLIARANGAESIVRPLLTPAFAGRDGLELEGEPVVDAAEGRYAPGRQTDLPRGLDTLPAPHARTSTPLAARSALPHDPRYAAADIPTRSPAPFDHRRDGGTESPRDRSPLDDEQRGAADEAAAVRSRQPADAPKPSHREPAERIAASAVAQPAGAISSRAMSRGPQTQSVAPLPADPAGAVPLPGANDPVVPSPVVRIAIGRIEVRANLPRTTLAARAAQSSIQAARRFAVTPKLTLEEYLKRGAGGR